LRIELGSLTLGRLGPQELIEEYIKYDQANEAVNFVNSINWNEDGNSCFVCLSAVMNYLLKFPLNDEREGEVVFLLVASMIIDACVSDILQEQLLELIELSSIKVVLNTIYLGLLEETLGCFYTPSRPIDDVIVIKYRDPLSRWSRKFFYHLLRYCQTLVQLCC
jgi:hypothetical protein